MSDGGGFVGCGARVCDVAEGITELYGVAVIASPLLDLGGVFGGPCAAVHGAVLAQCLGVVEEEKIGVEELACLDGCAIGRGVGDVVHVLSVAGFSTEGGVERASSEDFGAHVGVVT